MHRNNEDPGSTGYKATNLEEEVKECSPLPKKTNDRVITDFAEEAKCLAVAESRRMQPNRIFTINAHIDTVEKTHSLFDVANRTNNKEKLVEAIETAERFLQSKQKIEEPALLDLAKKVAVAYRQQVNLGYMTEERVRALQTLVASNLMTIEERNAAMEGFLKTSNCFGNK